LEKEELTAKAQRSPRGAEGERVRGYLLIVIGEEEEWVNIEHSTLNIEVKRRRVICYQL
jgi:hypothetical protein